VKKLGNFLLYTAATVGWVLLIGSLVLDGSPK
jgi:hypothetical protein